MSKSEMPAGPTYLLEATGENPFLSFSVSGGARHSLACSRFNLCLCGCIPSSSFACVSPLFVSYKTPVIVSASGYIGHNQNMQGNLISRFLI